MITWVFLHRVDVFPCARRSAMSIFLFLSEDVLVRI